MEVFILLLIFLHLKYQNISTSFYKLKNNSTFRDLLAVAFSHELSAFEHMVTCFKKVSTEIHIQFLCFPLQPQFQSDGNETFRSYHFIHHI